MIRSRVGNVKAQVNADVDFSMVESTSEQHRPNQTPESSAVRSQQIVEDGSGPGAQPAGVPGATSNQPPATGTAPINGAADLISRTQRLLDHQLAALLDAPTTGLRVKRDPHLITNFLAQGMDILLDAESLLRRWQRAAHCSLQCQDCVADTQNRVVDINQRPDLRRQCVELRLRDG